MALTRIFCALRSDSQTAPIALSCFSLKVPPSWRHTYCANRGHTLLLKSGVLSTHFQHIEQGVSTEQKQILWLQLLTIAWMCVEAAIAIFAAIRAHSVALLGFGADSGIELMSAFVVLLRFKEVSPVSEKQAARITGLLLFALAAFILGSSILAFTNPRFKPEASYLGIGLLVAAAIVMPWLSRQKRTLAATTNSASLRGDAVQSSMCGYLAWIALGGLVLNAALKVSWADPIAALLLLPIIVREAWEAVKDRAGCGCIR